jgi:hypothetical protein
MTQDEAFLSALLSVPSLAVTQVQCSQTPETVRLTFGEQFSPDGPTAWRLAATIPASLLVPLIQALENLQAQRELAAMPAGAVQ